MTDYYKEAEISIFSPRILFPELLLICVTSTEIKPGNDGWKRGYITSDQPDILLDHLRAIAWGPSVSEQEDVNLNKYHHYNVAVTVLKSTNV